MASHVLRAPGIQRAVASTRHLVGELVYERRYGIHTDGKIILDAHDAESIFYIGMSWRQLRRSLPPKSVTEDDVFIDIGSGLGRAVIVAAADYPFSRVIGVELVEEFHEAAKRNLASAAPKLRCKNVELVNADARTYEIPDDVTVAFINNSIRGSIFGHVIEELAASARRRPRRIRLIYGNPLEDAQLMSTGEWRRVRTLTPRLRRSRGPYGTTCVYEYVGAKTTR